MKQRPFGPWSQHRLQHRPRLLIEDPSSAFELAEFRSFEDSGLDVAWCSGPDDDEACPLTKGGECGLVDDADIVLMGPGMADHRSDVAGDIHRRRPDLPIVVQVPRHDPAQCPSGCIAASYPASVDGQVRSVWRALDQRPATRPPVTSAPVPETPPPSTAPTPTMARLIDLLGW